MKPFVAIIDYGMGNIYSIKNALNYIGVNSALTNDKSKILSASHLILPGVGSFNRAMLAIARQKLDLILKESVYDYKIPLLGICLGMQLLADYGTEDGITKGLGFIKGNVIKFERLSNKYIRIPHVGFNKTIFTKKSNLYEDTTSELDFYYTHSYRFVCDEEESISAISMNGNKFVSIVEKANIFGVQFHPEKSQTNGLKILIQFLKYTSLSK